MGSDAWLDVEAIAGELRVFFDQQRSDLTTFGSRVNQVFEAFVFAQVIAWHREHDWTVEFVHPKEAIKKKPVNEPTHAPAQVALRLKFSTKGRPSGYSYARCSRGGATVQIRHGLRVMTHSGQRFNQPKANVVLDVAVIDDLDLTHYDSDAALENKHLRTFGEAKHMSAFAELLVGFLGLVAEIQPGRLRSRARGRQRKLGLLPFLYVSGFITGTANGVKETVWRRGFAVNIYSRTDQLARSTRLHLKPRTESVSRPSK